MAGVPGAPKRVAHRAAGLEEQRFAKQMAARGRQGASSYKALARCGRIAHGKPWAPCTEKYFKLAIRRAFFVGWGTGVPSVAPHTEGIAESGSHPPPISVGAGAHDSPSFAKVFSGRRGADPYGQAERANHGAKRSYPSAQTDSRGRLSPQKILYIFRKICYNNLNK